MVHVSNSGYYIPKTGLMFLFRASRGRGEANGVTALIVLIYPFIMHVFSTKTVGLVGVLIIEGHDLFHDWRRLTLDDRNGP